MRPTRSRLHRWFIGGLLLAIPVGLAAAKTDGEGFVRTPPEEIQWKDAPNGMGVQMALLEGDPSKPGIYVIRVKFPPGVFSRNHYHPEDRHVIVLKGTWWMGTGDEFAPDKTVPMKTGSYVKHPAKAHHFDGAKDEEVILQIVGYGPTGNTSLRPDEGRFGPWKKP